MPLIYELADKCAAEHGSLALALMVTMLKCVSVSNCFGFTYFLCVIREINLTFKFYNNTFDMYWSKEQSSDCLILSTQCTF